MNLTRESRSEEETERFAAELAAVVPPGTVIALEGDLGAGKTAFALWHFDLYRLEDEGEMDEIGYEDCFYGEGVSLVEWASRMPDCLPENAVHVEISRVPERGDDVRELRVSGFPAKEGEA